MNEKYRFTIPGKPFGKREPLKVGRFLRPHPLYINYKERIISIFTTEYRRLCPTKGAVSINITAFFYIPASTSKKKREAMIRGEIRPTTKPDLDNIMKAIGDSLSKIAWIDDSQIVVASLSKYYSDRPRVEVEIEFLSKE